MYNKQKPIIIKRIMTAVVIAALTVSAAGCSAKSNDATTYTEDSSSESETTLSTDSEISDSDTESNREIHLSEDLKFLIEATDSEILERCEDPSTELYTNNFIAADGRSYRITFGVDVEVPALGLYAPIEMLLPEKSFYKFNELSDIFDGKLKIENISGKEYLIGPRGLAISTEIDGKTVYFLVERENDDRSKGDYYLPADTEVIFKGIAINGTNVTDNRDYM